MILPQLRSGRGSLQLGFSSRSWGRGLREIPGGGVWVQARGCPRGRPGGSTRPRKVLLRLLPDLSGSRRKKPVGWRFEGRVTGCESQRSREPLGQLPAAAGSVAPHLAGTVASWGGRLGWWGHPALGGQEIHFTAQDLPLEKQNRRDLTRGLGKSCAGEVGACVHACRMRV